MLYVLCWFLSCINMHQPQIYVWVSPLKSCKAYLLCIWPTTLLQYSYRKGPCAYAKTSASCDHSFLDLSPGILEHSTHMELGTQLTGNWTEHSIQWLTSVHPGMRLESGSLARFELAMDDSIGFQIIMETSVHVCEPEWTPKLFMFDIEGLSFSINNKRKYAHTIKKIQDW